MQVAIGGLQNDLCLILINSEEYKTTLLLE